jgi:pimeloyl-ACP methyl ester carboxylesterase
MMTVEDIHFDNNLNQRLSGRIYKPDNPGDAGVVFSHGLFSSKDGYKITRLAGDIVSSGHALMAFDFSFSGQSGGHISDISVLQEVADLAAAVRFFKDSGMKKIHLMGSSMGAAVTLLYASRGEPALSSLILIATPADIRTLLLSSAGIADLESLSENGMTAVEGIPIKNSFFREVSEIDMREAIKKIRVPVLAIHGGKDSVVDPGNVELLEDGLETFVKTVVIDDGDHNLTRDKDIRFLKETIINWITDEYMTAYA